MKNLDLNAFGVQEIDHQEMVKTDGGILPLIPLGFIAGCWAIQATICIGLMAIKATYDISKDNSSSYSEEFTYQWIGA